jgi:hypothetical protein
MTSTEFQALYGNEGKTRKWNPLAGLRKPYNQKKQALKETPGLLAIELGKDKPYQGKEKNLQKSTAHFLALYDVFKYCAFHCPNERENEAERVQLSQQGVKSGVSDWLILKPFEVMGVSFAGMIIELKVSGGSLSENQIAFLNEMYENGFHCSVCWNGESFEDLVRWAYL